MVQAQRNLNKQEKYPAVYMPERHVGPCLAAPLQAPGDISDRCASQRLSLEVPGNNNVVLVKFKRKYVHVRASVMGSFFCKIHCGYTYR